jgi:hypothetical protein
MVNIDFVNALRVKNQESRGQKVFQTAPQNSTFDFLDRATLVKLRLKAMRAGVWFRALPRIDRVLVDLTIKVADTIRSPHLARSILSIAGKLEGLLESKLQRAVREFGLPIARKLSLFAQKWGNEAAGKWASDDGFARYWAAIKLNERFSG